MEMKLEIPFQQLLTAVKTLTPTQKEKLKQELAEEQPNKDDKAEFIQILLNGPTATKKQLETIAKNRKAINQWRTK